MTLRAEAPAKINRELRVGPRRADGYHDILSRFATIDLADEIEAGEAPRFELACEPPELAADRSNLVARAAHALAEPFGIEPRVRLRVVKRVPIGGGLGGGSSDAATTLRLLSRLWRLSLSPGELVPIAASLGSDVAFFLLGGEADVEGRGERVSPREDGPAVSLTLLTPPFALSTPEVYAAFDRLGGAGPLPERLEIEKTGTLFGPNDLESAVISVRPEMGEYIAAGRRIARECAVTGSGSTIVLVGASPEDVAALAAGRPGTRVTACRTLGRDAFRRRAGF